MNECDTNTHVQLESLRIYGTVYAKDLEKVINNAKNGLKCVCADIPSVATVNASTTLNLSLMKSFRNSIEEFWIPSCVDLGWIEECFEQETNPMSNLKILESFAKCNSMNDKENESDNKSKKYDLCLSYQIFDLISKYCNDIEWISIDCKLDIEFAQTFKKLVVSKKKLRFVQMRFDYARYVCICFSQLLYTLFVCL